MSYNIIKKFANAPLMEALKMIRCGFELETNRFEGKDWNDYDDDEQDDDAIAEDQWSEAHERAEDSWGDVSDGYFEEARENMNMEALFPAYMKRRAAGDSPSAARMHVMDVLREVFLVRDYSRWQEEFLGRDIALSIARKGQRDFDDYFNDILQDVRMNWEDDSDSSWPIIPNVEFVSDGSVDGPEIRTKGALTPAQFLRALKTVTSYDLDVSTGCSFHTHLSLTGVKHQYGQRLAAALMEYFLTHWSDLPERVRTRLKRDRGYCAFMLNPDKYRFVHWHRQGTLEFRLFGNIDNYEDGAKCLVLAVRALQWAYKVVKLKTEKAMFTVEHLVSARDVLECGELNSTARTIARVKEAYKSSPRRDSSAA